ncbi:hypothetical protein [Arthrobacter sp.]|uniref:hypothetical protein n=1 Tax=Arthrobacter sp. TaxID=1667 RepID=UPI00339A89A8
MLPEQPRNFGEGLEVTAGQMASASSLGRLSPLAGGTSVVPVDDDLVEGIAGLGRSFEFARSPLLQSDVAAGHEGQC